MGPDDLQFSARQMNFIYANQGVKEDLSNPIRRTEPHESRMRESGFLSFFLSPRGKYSAFVLAPDLSFQLVQ